MQEALPGFYDFPAEDGAEVNSETDDSRRRLTMPYTRFDHGSLRVDNRGQG